MKVQERRLAKLEGANASALSLSFELRRWLGEQSRPDGVSRLPTPDDDGTGFDVAPVSYTSDIPLLGRWGTPLLFGPGSIHVAHTPGEYIDVHELRASVETYVRLVRELLAA